MTYSPRQNLMIRALMAIVAKVGAFGRDAGSEGAGYIEAAKNTGAGAGFKCESCAFWRAPGGCNIVKGKIERHGICRLHIIPQERLVATAVQNSVGNKTGLGRIRVEVK